MASGTAFFQFFCKRPAESVEMAEPVLASRSFSLIEKAPILKEDFESGGLKMHGSYPHAAIQSLIPKSFH